MHSNVWEWCDDAQGLDRVIRVGGWFHSDPGRRAAGRLIYARVFRYRDLGFRLALVPCGNEP
jgi:formylglycine-generating enzyme required for sulfatase activity